MIFGRGNGPIRQESDGRYAYNGALSVCRSKLFQRTEKTISIAPGCDVERDRMNLRSKLYNTDKSMDAGGGWPARRVALKRRRPWPIDNCRGCVRIVVWHCSVTCSSRNSTVWPTYVRRGSVRCQCRPTAKRKTVRSRRALHAWIPIGA